MLLLNIVVLFPMLIIPLFWPLLPIIFPAMNAYMLGRYFFQMAGGRHIGRKAADALGKQHRGKLLAAGLLMVAWMPGPRRKRNWRRCRAVR